MIVPYRGYPSKDGFIVIAAGNDKLFASLARVLGHPEWIDDARFRTNPDRVKNQDVLYRWIEDLIATRTAKEWAAVLDEAGVPNAPTQTIAEVLEHPQTKALGIMQDSRPRATSRWSGCPSHSMERARLSALPRRRSALTRRRFSVTAPRKTRRRRPGRGQGGCDERNPIRAGRSGSTHPG